jgi:hypothetical protein
MLGLDFGEVCELAPTADIDAAAAEVAKTFLRVNSILVPPFNSPR